MMRFEFDDNGYVSCILYGCYTGSCSAYTGRVPSEPEAYEDMDDWANRAKVQAYKLNSSGNLVYDAEKAASIPDENEVTKYTPEQCAALGIAHEDHTHPTPNIDTSKITDITCGQAGVLKIGKTVIMGGTIEAADLNNKHSSFRDCTIDLSSGNFAAAPVITAIPECEQSALHPYGIMVYCMSRSATSATLRMTCSYQATALKAGLHWMAIGISN